MYVSACAMRINLTHSIAFDVDTGMQPIQGYTQQLTACPHLGLTMATHTLWKHLCQMQDQETVESHSQSNPCFVHLKNACAWSGPALESQGQQEWE